MKKSQNINSMFTILNTVFNLSFYKCRLFYFYVKTKIGFFNIYKKKISKLCHYNEMSLRFILYSIGYLTIIKRKISKINCCYIQ